MSRLHTLALAAALCLGAAGALAQSDATASSAATHIKSQYEHGLGGLKRVAIPTFFVQFVRDQGIERDGGSLGMFQKQSATYFTQTRNVDPALLQKIADQLYDNLVGDLKTAGIEVVPIAEMDANSDFQEIRKVARQSPFADSMEMGSGRNKHMAVNVMVSAKGLPIVTRNVADQKWLPGNLGEGMSGMTLILGAAKAAQAWSAPLLNVRLTVSMVEQKGKGWGSSSSRPDFLLNRWVTLKTSTWEFSSDPYARFVEEGTAMNLTNARLSLSPDPNLLKLTQPVPIVGLELSGAKGEGVSSRGSGLLGALGRAAGGSDAGGADAYIDVEPANFSQKVTEGGSQVLKLFVEALVSRKAPS